MESKIPFYLVIISAILYLVSSLLFFIMLGLVALLILQAMISTTFNYNPGITPFVLGGAAIFLIVAFILMLRWRKTPETHRSAFLLVGIISLIIGIIYFLFPIGPFGPPPYTDPTAPGIIIMYSFPIIAGILTIITPFIQREE
ncbi:MAG: hypothetical protein ACFFDI_03970 [Promethearchaeota archaeon]